MKKYNMQLPVLIFILCAVVFFEYGKAFGFYFVGDDFVFISALLHYKVIGLWNPLNFLDVHYYPVGILVNALPALFGIFEPRWYVLVNFLFFSSCSVLVMIVYHRIVGSYMGGFLAALMFATAVPNSEVIYWKTGTQTIAMAFFSLLALLLFIRHLTQKSWVSFGGCFVAYALSVLCIEQGVLTFGILILYDLIFHSIPQFLESGSNGKIVATRFLRRHAILILPLALTVALKLVYGMGFSPVPLASRDLWSIPWLVVETTTKLIHLTNTILPKGSSPLVYRVSTILILLFFGTHILARRSTTGLFFLLASLSTILTISVMAWGPHSRYYCLPLAFYACYLSLMLRDVAGVAVHLFRKAWDIAPKFSGKPMITSQLPRTVIYCGACLAITLAGLRGNLIIRNFWETASLIELNIVQTVEDIHDVGTLQDKPGRKIYLVNIPEFLWFEKYSFIYVSGNTIIPDLRNRIGKYVANVKFVADNSNPEITIHGKHMEYVKLGRENIIDEEGFEKLIEQGHLVLIFLPSTMTLVPYEVDT